MPELLYNRKANTTLANLAAGGRYPHTLLIEGPEGSGKKTAAWQAAKTLLCTGDPKPCGECAHCVKADKRIHPDVRCYTVPEGKKEFPVETVREIRQDAYIAPNEGARKIYLIDRAHTMNAAAQNALLKIIEEPPGFVNFLLLCENRSRMLPTILSRAISIELEVPSVEECAAALETLSPGRTEQERRAAAAGAGGNIGRALGLLGSAKPSKSAADAKKLREELIYGDRYACLRVLAGYDRDRDGLGQTLSLLREGFAQAAVGREVDERLRNRVTVMQLIGAADAVERALLRAGRNVSIPLLSACMVEEVKAALAG